MLLGRLEKDGSRKVGSLCLWSLCLCALIPSMCFNNMFLPFCSSLSASHCCSVTPSLCSVLGFQEQKPSLITFPTCSLVYCHGSKSSWYLIEVEVFWHFSPCLHQSTWCDIWVCLFFFLLRSNSHYCTFHPIHLTDRLILTVSPESCGLITYTQSERGSRSILLTAELMTCLVNVTVVVYCAVYVQTFCRLLQCMIDWLIDDH